MQKTISVMVAVCIAAGGATGAAAQSPGGDPAAFTGPYAGLEAGLHEHHFFLRETFPSGATSEGRYYRSWGLGGGAFVGHDWKLSPTIRLGGEAGISVGGKTDEARFGNGSYYAQHPRYGYRVTGRAGIVLGGDTLLYGTFGYGGHRYRLDNPAGVFGGHEWGSSFTVGGGVEYRMSRHVGLRLDFRHLDNQMSHLLIGVPIRF